MLALPALLYQAPAPSEPPKSKPGLPARIEITTPFPVRLGSVGPREVREAVFGIRSLHDRPFRLRLLDLSLGLSVDPAQLAEPLQPGEARLLVVKVDPSGLEGYLKGAVRLGTDDPGQPNYILRYDMTVRPELTVDALRKSFGEVAPHESPSQSFTFLREGGDPLKVALEGTLPPHLEAEVVPGIGRSDLRVTLRPGKLKPGTTAGLDVLQVATNAPRQPRITLYLEWRISLPVIATPSRLVFSDLKTTLLAVDLRARNGRPFRILSAQVEGAGFQLLDQPQAEADVHTLRVRRTGRSPEAMLVLRCSGLEDPIQVPLRFLDPKAAPPRGPQPPPPPPDAEHRGHHH